MKAQKLPEELLEKKTESLSSLYRDMGVVQRKTVNKSGSLLLQTLAGLDFSDRPYTTLSLGVDLGYAFNDFWELWVHSNPYSTNSPRSYTEQLSELEYEDGSSPVADVSQIKMSYGGYIIWAPTYGKDSVGSALVLRSDTFFKLGASVVFFEGIDTEGNTLNTTGLKYFLGIGKTFFFANSFGIRIVANANFLESPNLRGQLSTGFVATVEAGTVFYF